jgi:hypothetical protein
VIRKTVTVADSFMTTGGNHYSATALRQLAGALKGAKILAIAEDQATMEDFMGAVEDARLESGYVVADVALFWDDPGKPFLVPCSVGLGIKQDGIMEITGVAAHGAYLLATRKSAIHCHQGG